MQCTEQLKPGELGISDVLISKNKRNYLSKKIVYNPKEWTNL